MRNKLLWTLPVLVMAFVLGHAVKTYAGSGENGRGFLWGGMDTDNTPNTGDENGTGWIAVNNLDKNGIQIPGTLFPPGSTNPPSSYGVTIPPTDGPVTGYAWSENYGWISFNGDDLRGTGSAPSCPETTAPQRVGNKITGWARILSIKTEADKPQPNNAGGWLGCIKLADTATPSYGVIIDSGTGTLGGYAWSDELGWIDFSRVTIQTPIPGVCNLAVAKVYLYTETAFASGSFCNSPTQPTPLPSFPSVPGTSVSWVCPGSNGGTSTICTALHAACLPNCQPDQPVSTVCPSQPVHQTDATCHSVCPDVNGTRDCSSTWKEVAP